MTIELTKQARAEAIASTERYFEENMQERIGNIAAGALLGFFLQEVGPPSTTRLSPTSKRGCRPASWRSTSKSMKTNSSTGASSRRV